MKFSRLIRAVVGLGAFSMVLSGVMFPAQAAFQEQSLGAEAAANVVAEHENSIADDAAVVTQNRAGESFSSTESDVEVKLPNDPNKNVLLETPEVTVEVSLPTAASVTVAEETEVGLLVYENGDGSYTVPIPGRFGDLQVNTVIESERAPRAFEYGLDFSAAVEIHRLGEAIVVLDSDGELLLTVAAPWATDASGNDVPTHYEIQGSAITQIVEHNSSFDYPIVADPWMGVTLFHKFKLGTDKGQAMYSAWVTPQAVAVFGGASAISQAGGYGLWLSVMRGSGWKEWKAKWPSISNKASLQRQYNCHVAASVYGLPFTRDYNLERRRPNRKDGNWVNKVKEHRCNWANATGGKRD